VLQALAGDLREYVDSLIDRGEAHVVEREVDPRFELAAVIARCQKESGRAIVFRKVRGSRFPVVANVYGSFDRLAEMLGTERRFINQKWTEAVGSLTSVRTDYIDTVSRPSNLETGTLDDLPRLTYRERDAAPYITAGVFLAHDPDTGVPNLSFARCMMLGDNRKMHCCIDSPHDLANFHARAEARNEALPVAILVGAPPPVFLAATASLPIEQDELALAASINGGKIAVWTSERTGLPVPANSEIVIEATIRPGQRAEDGPFGEFLGYYCGVNTNAYVLDVQSVSWRRHAYYQALLCGSSEDLTALSLSWGGRIFSELSSTLPGILDVCIHPTLYASIVKIDRQSDSHAREVIDRVFRINPAYNRMCIVVDRDIDIHDLSSVWWSFLTRGDLHSRVHLFPDLPGVPNANYQFAGYLGIDATTQPGLTLVRATTPNEEEIRLENYLAS